MFNFLKALTSVVTIVAKILVAVITVLATVMDEHAMA